MRHRYGPERDIADGDVAVAEAAVLDRERECRRGEEVLIQADAGLLQSCLELSRSGDHQRAGAFGEMLVHQQIGQSAEVVAVQMRHHHRVDGGEI